MDKKTSLLLIITFLFLAVPACNFIAPTDEPQLAPTLIIEQNATPSQDGIPLTEAEVPRVPLEEALTAIQSGAAVVVDVRSAEAYAASHIAGAISVPLDEIESNPAGLDLDKDQWIITYCT